MDYTTFKFDLNNNRTLAPKLLEELETGAFQHLLLDDSDLVTVITKDLSGNEKKQTITIDQAKAGLNNPKMTDMIIYQTEMKFEFKIKGMAV